MSSGGMTHHSNLSEQSLVENFLTPYLDKQCILDSFDDIGGHGIINLSASMVMVVLKTDQQVDRKCFKPQSVSSILNLIKTNDISVEVCTKEVLISAEIDLKNNRALKQNLLPIKDKVFVVMKFGDEVLDSAYESIKSVVEAFKLSCVRVDEIEHSSSITDQILEQISESKFVLVELTGSRPNCYYEAGYADALGKEIIYVVKDGEEIHFDLKHRKFIIWKTESDLRNKIRTRFEALTAEHSGISLV
jgi:nucleoside 2-deoxyribosyltransferase